MISGDGSSPDLNGLFNQATDVTAATATETFATGVARFAALVEGLHANSWADLNVLVGTNSFAKYASLFQSNGDMSLADYLAGKLGLFRVSTRVPALAASAQKGIVHPERAGAAGYGSHLEGRGADRRSVQPGREGPAGDHRRIFGRVAVHPLRHRAGRRSTPQAVVGQPWSAARA